MKLVLEARVYVCEVSLPGNCETAMQWLRQTAAGRQIDAEVAEGYGRPPDLEEVHACIKALRSHAAPTGDQMEPSGCSRSYASHGSRALHPWSGNLL
eukprot:358672-Chlamydomonas_euryale.AAC.6